MSSFDFLIRILLFLFVVDVIKKYYFKPHENKLSKLLKENKNVSNKKGSKYEIEEEEVFSNDNNILNKNSKIELIIKYDKYSHENDFSLFKNLIEKEISEIKIRGEEFPLPLNIKYFINFTYITQIATCLLLFFPKYLKIGFPFLSNNSIEFIEKYNLLLIFGNFFAHFILNKHMSKTGAFEIILNNKHIYSKLETKILPDVNKLKIMILNKIEKINDD